MENSENPTALRVKNSFSIENILSRPETKNQRRQEICGNINVSAYDNSIDHMNIGESEKMPNFHDNVSHDDPESNSEAASEDDGNSSVHSK